MGTLPDRRLLLGAGAPAAGGTGWALSQHEHGLLVIGPPRSGKTLGLVVPNVLGAGGPVVSTSTKPDVMQLTWAERSRRGRCWLYDPTGQSRAPDAVTRLRWSAVEGSTRWETAYQTARTMVTVGRRRGLTDQDHWDERAAAILGPLVHAAALAGVSMRAVVTWVNRRETDEALRYLEAAGADLALDALAGVLATGRRERDSIWSNATGALSAYRTEAALATADDVNFDPARFVRSSDTIYVCAPGHSQATVAPLVSGLVDRIAQARYTLHAGWEATPPPAVVLALDEVANIAPLPDLPKIVSEGGGQGVMTIACLQDLSQAETRWDRAARGFLTLFGAKAILPGVSDRTTLEAVSMLIGDHDVKLRSTSRNGRGPESVSWSTRRQAIVPPDAIRRAPSGTALVLEANKPAAWVTLARVSAPSRALTRPAAPDPSTIGRSAEGPSLRRPFGAREPGLGR